jgi:membrane associated rhomboid family serine protease
MIPLKDNIPARRFPAVNISLIVVNALVFIFQMQMEAPELQQFINQWGFVPARFETGEWHELSASLPIFTSIFLHGNLLHIVSNMWMLWIFGDNVEDSMGHGGYLLFYLLCGIIAVFAQYWAAPDSPYPMVGASGAIAGVLGAYFLTYPRAKVLTLVPIFIIFYMVELPAYVFLGIWMLLQLVQGAVVLVANDAGPGVAWWAHIGGFAGGILLLPLFRKQAYRPRKRQAGNNRR